MTTSCSTPLIWFGAAACALGLGCGGDGGDLGGTATKDFNLSYDSVLIQRQEVGGEPTAMLVSYRRGSGNSVEIPVKVVVNWPIKEGEARDLVQYGRVDHVTNDGGSFPELQTGTITFDSLGSIGEGASGEFFATFVSGGTLNGKFDGTVQLLSFGGQ